MTASVTIAADRDCRDHRGVIAAAQEPARPSDATLAEARQLINQDKPQAAIEKLSALPEPERDRRGAPARGRVLPRRRIRSCGRQLAPVVAQLPSGSIERREPVQVLGLCQFLTGRFAEAVPLLEETRQWASGNAELGYVLGQAYVQTRQPDRAREVFAALSAFLPIPRRRTSSRRR